jgi:hypothetical protein
VAVRLGLGVTFRRVRVLEAAAGALAAPLAARGARGKAGRLGRAAGAASASAASAPQGATPAGPGPVLVLVVPVDDHPEGLHAREPRRLSVSPGLRVPRLQLGHAPRPLLLHDPVPHLGARVDVHGDPQLTVRDQGLHRGEADLERVGRVVVDLRLLLGRDVAAA